MTDLTDPCEHCNADKQCAFIKYHADPNDSQLQTAWIDGTPMEIYGIVCTNCGMCRATFDPRDEDSLPDFEELPDGTGGSSFKVTDELE